MSIKRTERPRNQFYILDNRLIEDERLSWDARAVLIFILVKPDNWTVSPTHLANQTQNARKKTGRDAIYRILNELIDAGYVLRHEIRNDDGSFARTDYEVLEYPVQELAHTENPHADEPHRANQTLTRTHGYQEPRGTRTQENNARESGEPAVGTDPAPAANDRPAGYTDSDFERLWHTCRAQWFGAPGNKQQALKAFRRSGLSANELIELVQQDAARRRALNNRGGFAPLMKNVQGWINNRCWEDELGDPPAAEAEPDDALDPTGGDWI